MAPHREARLYALAVALCGAALLLVVARQITLSGWFSAAPAYRAQVAALLDGRLALSTAPEALFHDFAWSEGGVHQVWGLGVPLWQLPFELLGRVIGVSPFPDRIPLLAWLALMIYLLVRAWLVGGTERRWVGGGALVLCALLPAFVTLLRGRVGIYEEAAVYAYGAAMILLGGVLRLHASPTRWRLLVVLAAAGLAGFIRPTAACYGAATAAVAIGIWWQHRGRKGLVEIVIGSALFLGGGAALYATNHARFGDGLEFGHKLNLQSLPGNLYATRFTYPMQRASLPEATLELVTGLFDRPEQRARGGFYQKNLHHGVSSRPRWREYYFTTYAWPYLPLLVAGAVIGARAWRRRARRAESDDPIARWLVVWAVIALVPLLAFYLRSPFMSSRYQIDVAPGFAALLVIAWRAFALWLSPSRRGFAIACGTTGVLWLVAVLTSRVATPGLPPVDAATAADAMTPITKATKHARTLPGAYDLADPWLPIYTDLVDRFDRCKGDRCLHGMRVANTEQWVVAERSRADIVMHRPPPALYLNVYRWHLDTGQMPPATYAFVDDPRFLELEVSTMDGTPANWERDVRARIGLVAMRFAGQSPSPRGTTLRFEPTGALPAGLQVAFFAFGPDDELHKPMSRIAVHRIQWR